MTFIKPIEYGQSHMLDLHTRWKATMGGLRYLLDGVGSRLERDWPQEQLAAVLQCQRKLEAESRQLVARILARRPRTAEDFAVLADLALTYEGTNAGMFDSPGEYDTATHLGYLTLALARMAPNVELWSLTHEFSSEQRTELRSIAA